MSGSRPGFVALLVAAAVVLSPTVAGANGLGGASTDGKGIDYGVTSGDRAPVPGVSVSVTATPTKAVWTFGDGTTLTCNGPGVAWNPSLAPVAAGADPKTVQHRLGHASLTVTLGIYAKATTEADRAAAKHLDSLFQRPDSAAKVRPRSVRPRDGRAMDASRPTRHRPPKRPKPPISRGFRCAPGVRLELTTH
ncbi:MAG: hypothetical protein V9E99_05690 [Microthrixaceae bacterium]|nr:hypothetical protein [Microthrixaceae bacterium]HMT62579.1 hypothetical protein [Microthrixaceae bacterium]